MGDITLADEDLLYKVFGIDAELLIDHAWGYEPTEIRHIKAYKPKSNSLSRGQVLMRDYKFDEGRLIVKEMMELLSLELVEKGLVTQSVTLDVGYSNQTAMGFAHGTHNFNFDTNAGNLMVEGIAELYDRIVDEEAPIRRVYINCNNVHKYEEEKQLNFLEIAKEEELSKERGMQTAINEIRTRFGKNAMFKGMDLEEAATTLERNLQIGGHKSGNEE
jgi:DNA polymerase V